MAILPTGFGKPVIFEPFYSGKNAGGWIHIFSAGMMEDQIKDFEDLGISAVKPRCDEKTLEEI